MKTRKKLDWNYLGLISYEAAFDLMMKARQALLEADGSPSLFLLEHPALLTLGRRSDPADLIISEDEIIKKGVQIIQTDRGGKVTYHGPGQVVAYFVFPIEKMKLSVERFVCLAEEAMIQCLKELGINSTRKKDFPGLWIGNKKIASLGFHIHKGMTTHGIAINNTNDLTPFSYIHPCGLNSIEMTSIEIETGNKISHRELSEKLVKFIAKEFDLELTHPNGAAFS